MCFLLMTVLNCDIFVAVYGFSSGRASHFAKRTLVTLLPVSVSHTSDDWTGYRKLDYGKE